MRIPVCALYPFVRTYDACLADGVLGGSRVQLFSTLVFRLGVELLAWRASADLCVGLYRLLARTYQIQKKKIAARFNVGWEMLFGAIRP